MSISLFVVVAMALLLNITFYIDDTGLHYVWVKDIDVFSDENAPEFDSIEIISPGSNLVIKKADTFGYEFSAASSIRTEYSIKDGKLKIEQQLKGKAFGLQIANNDDHITVYVPEDANLKEIKASCKIGRYIFEGLNVERFSHEVLHGDTDITYCTIGELNIEIKSGNLLLEQTPAEKATINMVSGNLRATNFDTKQLDFDFITGDFRLEGKREGKSRINCFSADMNLIIDNEDEDFAFGLTCLDGKVNYYDESYDSYVKSNDKAKNSLTILNEKGNINIKHNISWVAK